MTTEIDFEALFDAAPNPYLVVDADLVVRYANRAYLKVTGRSSAELVGRCLPEAFPDNARDRQTVRDLEASMRRVLATGQPEALGLRRYDIPVPDRPGVFEERWWSEAHVPVPGPDGRVGWIIELSEDVTGFVVPMREREPGDRVEAVGGEVYARARELHALTEQLRQDHAWDREVAVTLQQAMLADADLARHRNIAVRYLPAAKSMNVCGDWYDVVELPPDRYSVAIGDVVGHGLKAAAVMGMLRSALSAAIRAVPSPAQALEVVGLYARSVDGALGTTVAKVLVDPRTRLIIYSLAGHPPPVLLHRTGSFELLDQAVDPPLAVRPEHVPRPQASTIYTPGDTLVLYTDGLIERRGEDIDAGLARLTDALIRCAALDQERIADTVLSDLDVAEGGADDIALVVIRL